MRVDFGQPFGASKRRLFRSMRSWSCQTHRNKYLKSFPVGGLVIGFSWWLSKTTLNEVWQKYDQPPTGTRHQMIMIGARTLVKCPVAVPTSWSWSKACFQLEWCIEANLKRFGEAMQEFGKARDIFKMLCAVGATLIFVVSYVVSSHWR